MNRSILKKLNYLWIFLLLISLSELVFILNTRKVNIISSYYVYRAQKSLKKNDLQGALNYLGKGAQYYINNMSKTYPGKIPDNFQPSLTIFNNNDLKTYYLDYIETINLKSILKNENGDLLRVYYKLALAAEKDNEIELAVNLFQITIFLNPELSFPHVELANLYLLQHDPANAESVLNNCKKFIYAKKHCSEYYDTNFQNSRPEEAGFMEKVIEDFYNQKQTPSPK